MITILNKHSVKISTKSESGCGDDYWFHLEWPYKVVYEINQIKNHMKLTRLFIFKKLWMSFSPFFYFLQLVSICKGLLLLWLLILLSAICTVYK